MHVDLGSLVQATERIVIEVALLDDAVTHRDAAVQRRGQAFDYPACNLVARALRVDDATAVNSAGDPVDREGVAAHRHLGDLGRPRTMDIARGDTASPAPGQRRTPAGLVRRQLEDAAQP